MIIKRPEDILATPPSPPDAEPFPVPFEGFMAAILELPLWGVDNSHLRSAVRIERAVEAGGDLDLRDKDLERLRTALDNPGPQGYQLKGWILRQCLPYFDAFATDDD